MKVFKISKETQYLWAKSGSRDSYFWLPLTIHLMDTGEVAKRLWRDWVSDGVKRNIALNIDIKDPEDAIDLMDLAERVFVFLGLAHDFGKATASFQSQCIDSFEPNLQNTVLGRLKDAHYFTDELKKGSYTGSRMRHEHASQNYFLKKGLDSSLCYVLGAHHGKTGGDSSIRNYKYNLSNPLKYHFNSTCQPNWVKAEDELLEMILDRSGFDYLHEVPSIGSVAQVLFTGLLIMADWIASNENYFPYIDADELGMDLLNENKIQERADRAWAKLSLPMQWSIDNSILDKDLFKKRFSDGSRPFIPHPMQAAVLECASNLREPGLMIIEAPMGQGKTEAALVAAEVMAQISGRNGVYFALPTQATSDAIFSRITKWIRRLDKESHSIQLMHGKSQFNEEYQKLFSGVTNVDENNENERSISVHEWFQGRKKSLLADFVVGTIDQLLLMALKQKHVMLRHIGLAQKVVIIDEVHAYDAYMNQYLQRALNWLGSYRVPVIVLSATLPTKTRQELVEAYLGHEPDIECEATNTWRNSMSYPLVTYTDQDNVKTIEPDKSGSIKKVKIEGLPTDNLPRLLKTEMCREGCFGVFVNTVAKAQDIAHRLYQLFPEDEVMLLHSGFLAPDRAQKEKELLSKLGKPGSETERPKRLIVVGTQVMEQSLDIDFDLIVTELCPIDLLIQRVGRLHRHDRARPKKLEDPRCYILDLNGDLDEGSEAVYGAYLLLKTKIFLPEILTLPDDISPLVQSV
ncbi:MAG: CRISPR-associated helicase Cas3', partial [Eubacteriales bacterium]|nr:CRISPR-associated helicase Cas3' [Eubacteriales bacterium]